MVARGKFFLYDSIDPALTAGSYTLFGDLSLKSNSTTSYPVDTLETHFNVTAPRLKLPPDQALMTFPPANSEGAFENRLPQIVLKRRTLPWDRAAGTVGDEHHDQTVTETTPWLALVVIAEGEGQLVHDQPWEECFTAETPITGPMDQPTGSYLSVPQSTVDTIFPTLDDISLLTHVREVNPDDTENAMGDDDGFLAVVIANRTPLFDTQNCKPKAYTACLISLEGQLGVLPPPTPPVPTYDISTLYINETVEMLATATQSGAAVPLTATASPRVLDTNDNGALGDAVRRGEVVFHEGTLIDRAGVDGNGLHVLGRLDEEDFLSGNFSRVRRDATSDSQVFQVAGSFAGFSLPLEVIIPETFYRFPVLTSWRFTCTGAGGFQQLMNGLDVGLLGTASPGGFERPLPPCTGGPREGEAPGEPPVTALPLEIAETGHVGLPHLTRTGENANAWYRGPFSTHELLRNPLADEEPFPILAHVSDHLRMMTPDGREDVSLAVAFETGRLMAMSQPSFVAALQRWRAETFGAARAKATAGLNLADKLDLLGRLDEFADIDVLLERVRLGGIGDILTGGLFDELDKAREAAVSQPVPLVRPGDPIAVLADGFTEKLATGLGLDHDLTKSLAGDAFDLGAVNQLKQTTPRVVEDVAYDVDGRVNELLDARLVEGVRIIAETAVGGVDITRDTIRDMESFETFDAFINDRLGRRR
ncbi:hypothetical protein MUY35_01250 [Aliiroseovarius sp. S1339]|uniref:hypothetical protein n=1 Tax=Aliiroseovarius sp. S1339 TaxID=2936990 RepID=UPI0020C07E33|nr:hypothetical protein [Aliiroseovarius sp. S1339]MCK8462473.1 hypothetical protein [Aliiroseovarius sp. S1339]